MRLTGSTKRVFLVFATVLFLAGCASSTPEEPTGVQDIKPGEKSIIQPPSPNSQQQEKTLEERAI